MIRRASIPNLLTAARLLAVPVALIVMLATSCPVALLWIFIAASLTDFLDGYLARQWKCVSAFGALVDPVADKLLVALMLLYLLQAGEAPLLPVVVILLREIYVSALREFISARRGTLPVSRGGKWKTALQMLSITLLLSALAYRWPLTHESGVIALWMAAALALTSAVHYSRAALPYLYRD